MKSIPTYIVDSFTSEAFKGNPAGVCILEEELEERRMLNIAQELNLSETAFVLRKSDHHAIRYFSPIMEIPLCGHATLASAKILFEKNDDSTIHFKTHQDLDLHIEKKGDSISMEFPVYETSKTEAPSKLIKALGISQVKNGAYNQENNILIVEIESAQELAALKPDFIALEKSHDGINGVSVTARSNDGFDFHSRYFWPWSGGNEDPVTGATHTFLAPYWSVRLGKKRMKSFQASKRTGSMELELTDDGKLFIQGGAVIVLNGTLTVH